MSLNVKIAYDELGLLLNENNLFYWNRLNDDGKKQLIQDLDKQFKHDGVIPVSSRVKYNVKIHA